MNWLYHYMGSEAEPLSEKGVNCTSCTIDPSLSRSSEYSSTYKCCEFSPFWSAFAIGAWIEEGGGFLTLFESMDSEPVFTIMGVMHTIEKRQKAKSLCQYFNISKSQCSIWHQRPATCSTFYCSSGYSNGLKHYNRLEDLLLKEEADLLFLWFLENKIELSLWSHWCLYMEKDTPLNLLNKKMLLKNSTEALDFYFRSYQWLKSQTGNQWRGQNIKKQLEQISQL